MAPYLYTNIVIDHKFGIGKKLKVGKISPEHSGCGDHKEYITAQYGSSPSPK